MEGPDAVDRSNALVDDIMAETGLEKYVGCTSFEMDRRPLMSIRPPSSSQRLIEICKKWFPLIMGRIKMEARYPRVFTLDKRSKLGSPFRKRFDNKLEVVTPIFNLALKGDYTLVEQDGCALQGVRLQPEARSKEREYVFATSSGDTYVDKVGERERTDGNGRIASRTRAIVNPSAFNLAKQPPDNIIHHTLLRWPSCKPDYSIMRGQGFRAESLLALDWKNFDHQAGYMAPMYAECVGGEYEVLTKLIWAQPVLCRMDGWRKVCFVRALLNYIMQFWSGDSSVAPYGKKVALSTFAEFIHTMMGKRIEDTLDAVRAGSCGDFNFRDYGDDMIVFGSKHWVHMFVNWLFSFVIGDVEDPAKFLGDVILRCADGVWRSTLDWESYLTNWYLAERKPGSIFRPKPAFGWVSRRVDYTRYGPPHMQKIFDAEDRCLARAGIDVKMLHAMAAEEAKDLRNETVPYRLRTEKAWMLSDEEKAELPEYNVVDVKVVRALCDHFLKGWNLRD